MSKFGEFWDNSSDKSLDDMWGFAAWLCMVFGIMDLVFIIISLCANDGLTAGIGMAIGFVLLPFILKGTGNLRQWPKKVKPGIEQKPKAIVERKSENSYRCTIRVAIDNYWSMYKDADFNDPEKAADWGRNELLELERIANYKKEKYEFTI